MTPITVPIITTNDQLGLLADLHGGKAFIPSFDDLALTDSEFEGGAAV